MAKKAKQETIIGRPRSNDRADIALKLVQWSKRDDAINLNAFCCEVDIVPQKLSEWAREEASFREAYQVAKAAVGARRELKLSRGQLHTKAYDLNAHVYDYFAKEERRDEMAYEASLKKAEEADSDDMTLIKMQHEALMSQIKLAQDTALKSERASSKTDNKS